MTRTMYDSTNPNDIPLDAQLVAGYINGTYTWPQSGWDRFPNAVHVPIATQAYVNDGVVLDVEQFDATPAQGPDWVLRRRNAGIDPTVYCSLSVWPFVRAAFQTAGVPEPHYWIARYDNVAQLIPGAVAKQYINPPTSGGHYDLSIVADFWPGIDGGTVSGEADFALQYVSQQSEKAFGHHEHAGDWLQDFRLELREVAAGVAALRTEVAALKTGYTVVAEGAITVRAVQTP